LLFKTSPAVYTHVVSLHEYLYSTFLCIQYNIMNVQILLIGIGTEVCNISSRFTNISSSLVFYVYTFYAIKRYYMFWKKFEYSLDLELFCFIATCVGVESFRKKTKTHLDNSQCLSETNIRRKTIRTSILF